MKATTWPLVLQKDSKPTDSPPSDENSHGFIAATNKPNSSESVTSKPTIPLQILKDQVIEFLRRLREINPKMPTEIRNIILKQPVLDLVEECHSIVEDKFEKDFSALEAKYYADLAEDQINKERNDGMNESDTFGTL